MLDLHDHLKRLVIERQQELRAVDEHNKAAACEASMAMQTLAFAVRDAVGVMTVDAVFVAGVANSELLTVSEAVARGVEVWLALHTRGGAEGRIVRLFPCRLERKGWWSGASYPTLAARIDAYYADPKARTRLADELLSLAQGATP